jgi:hypothetical protein
MGKAEHCTAAVPSHGLGALYVYQHKRVIECGDVGLGVRLAAQHAYRLIIALF